MTLRVVLTTFLAICLAGCTWLPQKPSDSNQVENLLAYYRHMTQMSPELQKREFADITSAYERQPDDYIRLQLVMALMLPNAAWRDDAKALQLLGAVDTGPTDAPSGRRDFVLFLEKNISTRRDDQRRCEQRIEAQREERRKAEQKLDGAKEECHKAEVLQQKLDELRDIDRDMRKRSGRKPRP